MNALSQLAIVAGLSLAAAGGTFFLKGPPKEIVFHCDPASLRDDEICLADVKGNVLWVDARSRAEWEDNGLKGSILWNMDAKEDTLKFESDGAMRVLETELVVVYCSSEACGTSRQIADKIRNLSLGPPVKTLHGGWDALKGTVLESKDSSSAP